MEAPKTPKLHQKKLDACPFFSRKKGGDSAIAQGTMSIISPPSLTSIELDQALGTNQLEEKKIVYKSLMFLSEGDVLRIPAMIFFGGVDFVYQH